MRKDSKETYPELSKQLKFGAIARLQIDAELEMCFFMRESLENDVLGRSTVSTKLAT